MPNTAKFTTSRSIVSLADRTTRQTNEHRTRRILFDRAGGGVHGVRALGPVARLAALVGGLVGFRARARHPLRAGLPPHTASTIRRAAHTLGAQHGHHDPADHYSCHRARWRWRLLRPWPLVVGTKKPRREPGLSRVGNAAISARRGRRVKRPSDTARLAAAASTRYPNRRRPRAS